MELSQEEQDELLVYEAEKLFAKKQSFNEYTIANLIRIARRAVKERVSLT